MVNKAILTTFLFALVASPVSAELYWQDTSLTYLSGSNYEVGDNDRDVLTLENASGHNWGETFLFYDRLSNKNDSGHATYGEIGADFYIKKFAKGSFVKNIHIATQAEFSNFQDNFLVGLGASFDVPGAKYFKINAYNRNNENKDSNQQVTVTWRFPFVNDNFIYDGFADFTNSSDDDASSSNITSQLKWDAGKNLLKMKPGKLFLGVEYVYWNNKFGIENVDERNLNFLTKFHF